MFSQPQQEHQWLGKLVGEWTFESECVMGPGMPMTKSTGAESVRSLGGLWTIGEGKAGMPDGDFARTIMTLGYDPRRGRFVGTFVASVMAHLWVYDGRLDEAGKVLTLDTEGPDFSGGGDERMVRYQDVIEFVSDDHRTLISRSLGDDGVWRQFMTAHYRRNG